MDGAYQASSEELFTGAAKRPSSSTWTSTYFHNCLYESVWKDNRRRHNEKLQTWDVLHKYPHDYKIVFVGDATMSPYEITYPGGSVEHWNEEAGAVWPRDSRDAQIYEALRVAESRWRRKHWDYTPSIGLISQIMNDRDVFLLTLQGLDTMTR